MVITPNALADFLYNKKLPQIYRDEDSKIGYPLKRFIESLAEGGFKGAIGDIENVMVLVDPNAIPEALFPYLCESFGLEYFPDIDVSYQRKFLWNLGELVRRRGTFSSVHFMIRALTGLESELSLEDTTLKIVLLAKDLEQTENIEISKEILSNYVRTQIPYYITPVLSSRIAFRDIESKSYTHSAVVYRKHYKIISQEDN